MRQPTPPRPVLDPRAPRRLAAARWAIGAVVAILAAGALYVGFWYSAAGVLRDSVLEWIEARRQQGAVVAFERLDIGGFPFHLRLSIEAPAVAWTSGAAPWEWRAGRLTAAMRPWNFRRFTVRAPGRHAVMWTADGIRRAAQGRADGLDARLRLEGGGSIAAHVEARRIDFSGDAPLGGLTVGGGTVDLRLAPDPDATDRTPTADLRLAARDLGVPSLAVSPLGGDIAALDLAAGVLGPVRSGPPLAVLAGWRDDGGTVEVRHLGLTYGPLALVADGTVALDAAMQPIGAFTARIEGFFETVDALRENGIIRPRDAVTAKMVLGVLAKRNEAGRLSLAVPLTLQDRRLYAGPVPLIEVPPVSW